MKLKLLISYVGTAYCGWQIQERNDDIPQLPTIQNELEQAFLRIFKIPVRVIGASRTDSGVHAEEQVAHCTLPFEPKNMRWEPAINNQLPHDIRVKEVTIVDDSFHAHMGSTGKIYTYTLWTNRNFTPPRLYPFSWSCGAVDFEKINQAIPYLLGTHDFKAFQNTGTLIERTVRTLEKIEIIQVSEYQYDFIFKGSGFLKQMIRNIMGLLVYVGKGRVEVDAVKSILEAKVRDSIFPTAPAQGLTLNKVLF